MNARPQLLDSGILSIGVSVADFRGRLDCCAMEAKASTSWFSSAKIWVGHHEVSFTIFSFGERKTLCHRLILSKAG